MQASGREVGDVHQAGRLANGRAKTDRPAAARYAARGHLAAEVAVLNAAGRRGAARLDREQVTAWLDTHDRPTSAPPNARPSSAWPSSDAALAVLVGAAGTGKSYTVGALDSAWRDLTTAAGVDSPRTGGRVLGLTVAQIAADVLREDGVADTANLAAFLAAQARLTDGRRAPERPRWQLTARDLVVIDEASMVDTATLTRVQHLIDAAGARMVLLGDPHQLGAVGAGGMMRAVIDRQAETYTLTDVRRFAADWERDASLRLRDGDQNAVTDYDAHGRIIDGGTLPATIAQIARAAAADRIAGKTTLVVTSSNTDAATVAAAIRRHLVEVGQVSEDGVVLGRDQNTAGVGDLVQARRIDHALGLTNRETYTVTGIREDGGLDVTSTRTGTALVMPADYLAADAALAYASTAHAAQGATVDTGHVLLTSQLDRAAAYVGLTRGREGNTAWAVTDTGLPDALPQTGRGLLAAALEDPDLDVDAAAIDLTDADAARRANAATLFGLIEDETHLACRQRLDADLDTLTADGVLGEVERARLGADQGSEHLARLLRAYEQAGHDPAALLRQAIERRSLADARSVAQTIAARIHPDGLLPTPIAGQAPERIDADRAGYLHQLQTLLDDRRTDLANDLAAEPPAWAVAALGPVPDDEAARGEWLDRAGVVAGYREATEWKDPALALGRCPGVHSPEKRAAWHAAYAAAGMPEERRPEAEMTTGRLLVRVRAAERAKAAAPEAVYEQQRERHLAAEAARREAVLAAAAGRVEDAARLDVEAALAATVAAQLDEQSTARGHWLAYYAETLNAGDSAGVELRQRGQNPGTEPDRVTAEEWLAADEAARREDDAHRVITEADLYDADTAVDVADAEAGADGSGAEVPMGSEMSLAPPQARPEAEHRSRPSAAALAAEVKAAAARAQAAFDELAAHAVTDATAPAADDNWYDTAGVEASSEQATLARDLGMDRSRDRGAGYDDGADSGSDSDAAGISR